MPVPRPLVGHRPGVGQRQLLVRVALQLDFNLAQLPHLPLEFLQLLLQVCR